MLRAQFWLSNAFRRVRLKPSRTFEEYLKAKRVRKKPSPNRQLKAVRLADKLWGGFSIPAKADLEELYRSSPSRRERIEAAWQLARWHRVQNDHDAALQCLRTIAAIDPKERLAKQHLLLEADLLLLLKMPEEARALAAQGMQCYGNDTDLLLVSANTLIEENPEDGMAADERRLEIINRVFLGNGLHPIRKIDQARPLGIDNITASIATHVPRIEGPKVTVLMPAHNAAKTIGFALRGLREQTWQNLEVLVVDDVSTDGTSEVVHAVAALDNRIRLIRLDKNSGAYAARNKGLEQATGEFVTVHDADDWSHPQKIEIQLRHLLDSGDVSCTSNWVRVSPELRFTGTRWPTSTLLDRNLSSFLLRTEIVREFGGWDPVRFNGDAEFISRTEAKYGISVPKLREELPLSFALDHSTSLTRSPETNVWTLKFGARAEYRQAYKRWHSAAQRSGDFYLNPDSGAPRKFPAPAVALPARTGTQSYDVVFVNDFALAGGTFVSALSSILAALRAGLRVGVFHWRRYDLHVNAPLNEHLATLIDSFEVDMIVSDQNVTTKHLVVFYPPILRWRIDRPPKISFGRMHVIVNQMASRLYSGGDVQYDPLAVRENLEAVFGTVGEWCPISGIVRELMEKDPRYPQPNDVTWTPLLDTDEWCRREIVWRGALRKSPVIGRHGRDHYTKWPSTREAIEQAYCVQKGWQTRFLGGAKHPVDILGSRPANWSIQPFSAEADIRSFLNELDFLIHFPHEDYIEEFGRCAMEAMAVGIPVILPPHFAGTFGDAAIYCEPSEVAARVEELWNNEDDYLEQAHRGRTFVLQNCGLDQLIRRLHPTTNQLLKPSHASADTAARYRDDVIQTLRDRRTSSNIAPIFEQLSHEANAALARGPYSVTDKPHAGPSGKLHDYWTLSPYWWPDPDTADGLPYIKRDGRRAPGTNLYEPGSERYDRSRLQRMFDDTAILALAWASTGRSEYAEHARMLVHHWFVNPPTRMTPRLTYAQTVPGKKGRAGRGIIEAKDFHYFLDSVSLLNQAGILSRHEMLEFRRWLEKYHLWLKSSAGQSERRSENNRGTYYDLQVFAISAFLGKTDQLPDVLRQAQERLQTQFEPDGSQPHELARTMPLHYSCFNLMGWTHLAALVERHGEDLWRFETPDGRGIKRALEWLFENFDKPIWPVEEVAQFDRDRLWPLCFTYLDKYGASERIKALTPPNRWAVKPLFHPFDGIRPFWLLWSKDM